MKLLIDHGADPNAKDNNGQTPLHFVRRVETAQLLIDSGAVIKVKDNLKKTPLHYAPTPEIKQLLKKHATK